MKTYYEQDGITIYHGDCREILPQVGVADLIVTDPPYGHNNNEGDLADAWYKNSERGWGIKNDGADVVEDMVEKWFLQKGAPQILRTDGGCCCCCCCGGGGPDPMFARWSLAMDRNMVFNHAIVWYKGDWSLGWHYRRAYEFVLVAYNGKGTRFFGDSLPNVISMPKGRGQDDHPNYKPVPLMGGFIARHSEPGELVVDPFMGGGSTLVAARQLGRKAIGIEIEERYCEIAAKRLAQRELFGI